MSKVRRVLVVDDTGRVPRPLPVGADTDVAYTAAPEAALRALAEREPPDALLVCLASQQAALNLLVQSRAEGGERLAVGLCVQPCETDTWEPYYDAGVDELLLLPLGEAALRRQLPRLLEGRRAKGGFADNLPLGAAMEGSGMGTAVFQYDGAAARLLYADDPFWHCVEAMGFHNEGEPFDALRLLPAADAQETDAALRRSLAAGNPLDMVVKAPPGPDGPRSLHLRALPLRGATGPDPVLLGTLSCVPVRSDGGPPLGEQRLGLASLMNAVPGGIAVYDLSGKPALLYYNDVLRSMVGYTAREYDRIMEEDPLRLVDPRDRELVGEMIGSFRKNPKPIENAFRAITKSGEVRWLRVSASPAGQGMLCVAVYIDVTSDRQNQESAEQMRRELYYRADHDALTGLPNREAFYHETAQLLQRDPDTRYVILMMDIERFKVINDMFGKEAGDRVLVAIGQGMEQLLRRVGTCARLEADHFVACLPLRLLDMDRILQLLDRGLKHQNLDYRIQASFGLYLVHNINLPVHQMCDRALMALKTVKGSALKRYAFYDDQLRRVLLDENTILAEMHDALAKEQFKLYLQPIFTVDTQQPVSAEALVRWHHPDKGLIRPDRFIPLFERNGFITKLDLFIFEKACQLLKSWQEQDYPLTVSVNISRIDLYSPSLCDRLLALLARYGVKPGQLRLELTESAYTKDPQELVVAINSLHEAGFAILMDDFGSGYSSLNVLMDMPVDALKLDMRFLEKLNVNPRAASILTSVVRMAKWLHMPVVAEGVETAEQLSFLRSIGCDHVQGYLFSKPISVEDFTARYISPSATEVAVDLIPQENSVDLSCLWDTSPKADTLFNGMIGALGIYELCDDRLEVRRVNDTYYELFGCTPRQVFEGAQEALFTVHPDDRAGLMEICKKASQTGRVERFVCRHVHSRANRQTWLEARLRHLGKAGLNDVFCFAFTDVTEQKEFEQARALRNYTMALRGVYSTVFELNLSAGSAQVVYTGSGEAEAGQAEKPLATVAQWLASTLQQKDEELLKRIFEPGYLRGRLRESASGYYVAEHRVHGEGGKGAWASFTFIPVPSDTGEERYLLCVADVDSRRRADELLQENKWLQLKQVEQQRYQQLMEHLGTTLLEWDIASGSIIHSRGFERYAVSLFQLQSLQSHKDLEPYIHPKDLPVFRMFVNDLLSHGNAAVTLRLLGADGSYLWCRLLCSLVENAAGRIERCVAAVNQIDEQMKIRESFLDEQTRFQAFADNFMVGLGVYEVHGEKHRISYLSGGYRRMVGYGEEEPLYDATHSYLGVHPDDVPRFQEGTRALLASGKPYTIDYRVFHKDGRVLWLRSLNAIFPGTEPGHTRIYAVIQDVTELKEACGREAAFWQHTPAALALYDLADPRVPRTATPRMAVLLAAPLADSPAGATLGQALAARLQAGPGGGTADMRDRYRLLQPGGAEQPVEILTHTETLDGQPQCFVAALAMDCPQAPRA